MRLANERSRRDAGGEAMTRACELVARSTVPARRALPSERKFAGVALERVEADGSFSGYASLFGAVDLAKDVIERGAFRKSLSDRGVRGIRMLWQHDPAEPIGAWTDIREDGRGLFVRGKLTAQVGRAREILSLMRAGALDGLSIGFRTVRARKDADSGTRRIIEADLWEISVVTFPMLPGARVASVKTGPSDARERVLAARMRAAGRMMRIGDKAPQVGKRT